jgi:hypothetical protein
MCQYQLAALAVLSLPALLFAQDQPAGKAIAGTWQANFRGSVFCTLKIEASAGITGTLSAGNISVNDDGDLTDVEPSSNDRASAILNPKIDGHTLTFEWKDRGDDEVLKIEIKFTAEDDAQMRFIGENGIKPIHLHRVE